MIGVDRGNRPAKVRTKSYQSAKHRRRPVWQATTCRHSDSLYHISWSRSLSRIRACGLPHMYDCWCLGRTYDMTGLMPETVGSTSYQFTRQSGPLDSRALRHAERTADQS